mmetsp:Transcript_8608/g.21407  ORF Transcript_8608/g.21407 Transcript_8608/m.21407 type:complete len:230 (+) Transcript_8608:269-958(+)
MRFSSRVLLVEYCRVLFCIITKLCPPKNRYIDSHHTSHASLLLTTEERPQEEYRDEPIHENHHGQHNERHPYRNVPEPVKRLDIRAGHVVRKLRRHRLVHLARRKLVLKEDIEREEVQRDVLRPSPPPPDVLDLHEEVLHDHEQPVRESANRDADDEDGADGADEEHHRFRDGQCEKERAEEGEVGLGAAAEPYEGVHDAADDHRHEEDVGGLADEVGPDEWRDRVGAV